MKRLAVFAVVLALFGAACDDDEDNPNGPSGQPSTIVFTAVLLPANEVPPIGAPENTGTSERDDHISCDEGRVRQHHSGKFGLACDVHRISGGRCRNCGSHSPGRNRCGFRAHRHQLNRPDWEFHTTPGLWQHGGEQRHPDCGRGHGAERSHRESGGVLLQHS